MASPIEIATRLLNESKIEAVPYQNDRSLWSEVLPMLEYFPVSFQEEMVAYQYAYQRDGGAEWSDLSMTLIQDGKPVGIWPLSLSISEKTARISSYGIPVLPPLIAKNVHAKTRRAMIHKCLRFVHSFCLAYEIKEWESVESFGGDTAPGLSEWHKLGMQLGASAHLEHELYVDLSKGLQSFKNGLRKSYKSLWASGARLWKVGVLADAEPNTWEEFRQLHCAAAGGSTRSQDSWNLQHDAIAAGQAMLVHLRNESGEMVGGGFFNFSRDEALYSVGAYNRSLFDKPLGHVVQFKAVEEMIERGLKWYKIGARPYSTDERPPNDKELSIAHFKQGFASHLMPQFRLTHHPIDFTQTKQD